MLAALAEPRLHYRAPDHEVYARVLAGGWSAPTENEVPSSARDGGIESAIVSLCWPGERVLAVSVGSFGDLGRDGEDVG